MATATICYHMVAISKRLSRDNIWPCNLYVAFLWYFACTIPDVIYDKVTRKVAVEMFYVEGLVLKMAVDNPT